MTEKQLFPKLNIQYREEGWGKITDEALGILPENVESQARSVARWAFEKIAALEARIAELESDNTTLRNYAERYLVETLRALERAEAAEARVKVLEEVANAAREFEKNIGVAGAEVGSLRLKLYKALAALEGEKK